MLIGNIFVDATQVDVMLARMEMAISPPGISGFLKTQVDPYIRLRAERRFIGEGDEVVGHWEPLLDVTNVFRQKQGFPPQHPINVRSGEMKRYITESEGDVIATGDGATLTTPGGVASASVEDKIRTAQLGKASPPTVARPVLGVSPVDVKSVLISLMEHIGGAL